MMIGEHFKKGIGNAAGRSKITMSSGPSSQRRPTGCGTTEEMNF